jgi:hypothetical protein
MAPRAPPAQQQPVLQADEDVLGEDDERPVVVPAPPEAQVIGVEAQLASAFLAAGLKGPAPAADADQLNERRLAGALLR